MTKYYSDLDLKSIREALNIDFAHFTYRHDQCSCCYGPRDLPKLYWKDGIILEGNEYSYILFKNANNGRGCVTKYDAITDGTCVSWRLNDEQLEGVVKMLQEQLGIGYKVVKPEDNKTTIVIEKLPIIKK